MSISTVLEVAEAVDDGSELVIVGEDAQELASGNLGPAPAVETVCVFPKNGARCEKYATVAAHGCTDFSVLKYSGSFS